jgi:acyl dehydratase
VAGLRLESRGATLTLTHSPSHTFARIEDFEVGQRASFTKTFTDEDVRRFIEITGDANPLHVDDAFAGETRFGRRILHGMLSASILSTMVGMHLPGTGAVYRSQTLRFLRPVHVGDTLTAHFVVRSIDRRREILETDFRIPSSSRSSRPPPARG